MIRRWLISLIAVTAVSAVSAAEFALTGGAHSTDVDTVSSSARANGRTGWHAGALGFVDLRGGLSLRAGAVFARHEFDLVAAAGTHEIELSYLEVPLTVMYLAQDSFGFFIGPKIALNVGDDCTGPSGGGLCLGQDAENLVWGAEIGGHFRFAPNWGAEIAYSRGFSDVTTSTENLSSVAFSLLFLY